VARGDESHSGPTHGSAGPRSHATRSESKLSLKTYQKSNPCIPTRTQIIGLQNFKEGEKNKKTSETLILHTSERSRFLGSCFATSGGSTTWLKAQIRDKISQQTKGGKRKSVEEKMVTALPVLVGVVEILVGVLDLTHFSL
jgi:hypothetical protein